MTLKFRFGGWIFEITSIKARRVDVFGDAYNGVADVRIMNGKANVEGLLCKDEPFAKKDYIAFKEMLKSIGCEQCNYDRFKENVKIEVEKKS